MKFAYLLASIVLLFAHCGDPSNNVSTEDFIENDPSQQWYQGGTLHKEDISAWNEATAENKIATCADFMAKLDNTVPMSELKMRSHELVRCIDGATAGLPETYSEKISAIASKCTVALGYY